MNTTRGIAMTNRMRQLRPRDAVLFMAVVAVVAVLGVVIGRELGIGQQTGASVASSPADESPPRPQQQSEEATALTLSLSAPKICETKRGEGFAGHEWVYDDEGERVSTRVTTLGWANVAEIPVRWKVTGGTGPYTLVIDNEPRDGFGPYEGASGTASVSCAPNPGKVTYNDYHQHRWYHADPEIDSGPKTIQATVTDATGATTDASVNIYTILQLGGDGTMISGKWLSYRLNSGNTYRYNGTLFTIPQGITILPVESWQGEGGYSRVLAIEGTGVWIIISRRNEELYRIFGAMTFSAQSVYPDQGYDAIRGSSVDTPPHRAASAYLDDLMASRGQLPAIQGSK